LHRPVESAAKKRNNFSHTMTKTLDTTICLSTRNAILLLSVALCIPILACNGSKPNWTGESTSPDGHWIATARTFIQSGFGTGYIGTDVYLKGKNASTSEAHILGLSYKYEVPSGITDVEMRWISATHLAITYRGSPTVEFQAIKCDGLDISARDLSSEETNPSQ
jgi:hypothetical protein